MWKVMIVSVMVLVSTTVQAQLPVPRFNEFFKQTKKQRSRMLEQITLLQVYIEVLKKGYRLVQDGLQLIDDIKQGDFSIHNGYFTSLKKVNPAIKKYSKVNELTSLYEQLSQLYRSASKMANHPVFNAGERDAVERIFVGLLREANKDLVQVQTLTASGHLELKDDERLQRIEGLWVEMQERYAFAKDFTSSIQLLLVQQQRAQQEANIVQQMIGQKQ